jgi:hypothetical protein
MLVLAAAMPARAATVKAYDESFVLEVPSTLITMPFERFKDRPKAQMPLLALQKPMSSEMPALLIMRDNGADPKSVAQKELESFIAHTKGNPNFKATKVETALLSKDFKGFWFSDGRKTLGRTMIYFKFAGKVLKAACPNERRDECRAILGTIRVPQKSEAQNG